MSRSPRGGSVGGEGGAAGGETRRPAGFGRTDAATSALARGSGSAAAPIADAGAVATGAAGAVALGALGKLASTRPGGSMRAVAAAACVAVVGVRVTRAIVAAAHATTTAAKPIAIPAVRDFGAAGVSATGVSWTVGSCALTRIRSEEHTSE